MRRTIATVGIALVVAAAAATAALAHTTPYAWTVARAQLLLPDSTNIALPADLKASLAPELDAWLAQFRPLLLTAQADPDEWRLAQTYQTYIDRFLKARASVNAGLSIDSTKCAGQGKALTKKRYKHFRCSATSYVLEIPNIELVPGADPALPEVVEATRRSVGPFQAVFTVHVTGKTRMLSQRAS